MKMLASQFWLLASARRFLAMGSDAVDEAYYRVSDLQLNV